MLINSAEKIRQYAVKKSVLAAVCVYNNNKKSIIYPKKVGSNTAEIFKKKYSEYGHECLLRRDEKGEKCNGQFVESVESG